MVAESVRLIEFGVRADPVRLSRRRRFAAVAVDVVDDVAVTLFVRRGAGMFHQEAHVLARTDGRWVYLGGGGAGTDDDGLGDRPGSAELGGLLAVSGGGWCARGRRRITLPSWGVPRSIRSCW